MANKEQLEVLKQGVRAWNEWRIKNNPVIDLSGAKSVRNEPRFGRRIHTSRRASRKPDRERLFKCGPRWSKSSKR